MKDSFSLFSALHHPLHQRQKAGTSHPAPLSPQALARCSTREARALVDYALATRHSVLPLALFARRGQEVLRAAAPPEPTAETITTLRFAISRELELVPVANLEILNAAIFAAYRGDEAALLDQVHQFTERAEVAPANPAMQIEFRPEQGEVPQFLATLVDYAISSGASDLHLTPGADGCYARLRIAGELLSRETPICSPQIHKQLVTRTKVLARLDPACSHPQDGSFSVPAGGQTIAVRVSLIPTIRGEKIALRFLGRGKPRPLEELGLSPPSLSAVERFLRNPDGALLVCGPTGSGKTTTLYSIIDRLRAGNLHLASIEDPVELEISGIMQVSLDPNAGLSNSASLRAVLRQDPDVILVGEIRDAETAGLAFHAALSGHRLLTSLHARSAPEVLLRLKNWGIDGGTMGAGLTAIIAQRLIRKLCEHCKVLDLTHSNAQGIELFQPTGCRECAYGGYGSLTLIDECLAIDSELSEAIAEGRFERVGYGAIRASRGFASRERVLRRLLAAGEIDYRQFRQFVDNYSGPH